MVLGASGLQSKKKKKVQRKNSYLVLFSSSNKVKRYPRSHSVCSQANIAICGFWGQVSTYICKPFLYFLTKVKNIANNSLCS